MKIYTNKLLTWPSILHVRTNLHMGTAPWQKFNFYKIDKVNHKYIKIYSKSPMDYLFVNNYYYAYNFCFRHEKLDGKGNPLDFIFNEVYTSHHVGRKIIAPKDCEIGDYIVVINDDYSVGSLNAIC